MANLTFFLGSFYHGHNDTHNTQQASTILNNIDPFSFGNIESKVEDESDWHDEAETAPCQPTRYNIKVCSKQIRDPGLTYFLYREFHGRQTAQPLDLAARTCTLAVTRWRMVLTCHLMLATVLLTLHQSGQLKLRWFLVMAKTK